MNKSQYAIIGAGLAGTELALILDRYGIRATVFEQKPGSRSAAHSIDSYAELVCSNSFRSDSPESGPGLLKREMRLLGSPLMDAAVKNRVPAGKALATDRRAFAEDLTRRLSRAENIAIINRKIESLDDEELKAAGEKGIIVACGPMGDESLINSLAEATGRQNCYFYDAIAPIVWSQSLDSGKIFRASRYEEGEGDYLNAPMNKEEYERFVTELRDGKTFAPREFETEKHFEGCMPIEALAKRGMETLAHGPLKPVGLTDPATGRKPWAVLQLRPETNNFSACNLVGCQTKLLQPEQERIFKLIPGMENAEFVRFGSMHRNAYVNAPEALDGNLGLRGRPGVYLIGQITGVEGYIESAATGLWLGHRLAALETGNDLPPLPETSALGALLGHLKRPAKKFQPSNITFGLMPDVEKGIRKRDRKKACSERAVAAFDEWLAETARSGVRIRT
ncbi:MAG: methylenetetrahydrofolate--tRNA-(uracil(54)-C(5))-methyltransferase (FADH(2)-oxidizing) TrmFO [Desulfovibrio sp.]|nr:methylenetetrahydrofolate--tRNA-(uracil(54)-C(5))-methyltransferase (FADH(2)-oxidizing) TrmFO [Desulfovibrio sp.]